nr:protein kinase [Victivallales bacterium]
MDYIDVPDSKDFDLGVLYCKKCGAKNQVTKGLQVEKCVSCGVPFYTPMRLREYLIYKPLGGGGEGFVYKASKKNSEQRFAIKLVPPSKKDMKILHERLLRDAQTASSIGHHKNLVELVEYGTEGENAFIVFKFINGERLDEFIAKRKHLSEKKSI